MLDALGDPTRRAILDTLRRQGPSSVAVLADRVPVSRPAISQHLKVLGLAGLVDHEPQGTRNIYRIDRSGLAEVRDWLDQFWGDALDAFAEHVRRIEGTTETEGTRSTEDRGTRRTDDGGGRSTGESEEGR